MCCIVAFFFEQEALEWNQTLFIDSYTAGKYTIFVQLLPVLLQIKQF